MIQLVGSPEVQAQLDLARRTYGDRRAVVIETLRGAGIEIGGRSGFNVWVPVDDEAHVVAGMERRGYAIRSGARFRQISAPGIRISAAHSDGDTLLEATNALVEVIGARQRSRSV